MLEIRIKQGSIDPNDHYTLKIGQSIGVFLWWWKPLSYYGILSNGS